MCFMSKFFKICPNMCFMCFMCLMCFMSVVGCLYGPPLKWVEFIVKFCDVVHDQPHLSDKPRNLMLIQHLGDEAKRAVKEYINDPRGYPLSLKKLKYIFGQRPTVARAVLSKVTKENLYQARTPKGCLICISQSVIAWSPSSSLITQATCTALIRCTKPSNVFHPSWWSSGRCKVSR